MQICKEVRKLKNFVEIVENFLDLNFDIFKKWTAKTELKVIKIQFKVYYKIKFLQVGFIIFNIKC